MKTLYCKSAEEWRDWLKQNHDKVEEIWLVYLKKSKKPTLEYGVSVEEALCFGWIDSVIRSIDETRYARKFTPRKDKSNWSDSNKKRVERLIKDGRMTPIGLAKIEAAKNNGCWDAAGRPEIPSEIPTAFKKAMEASPKAKLFFEQLTPGYQKQYIGWIATAKRPETIQKRVKESIQLLEKGEKLGIK